jgi:hypothetical protein
MAKVDPAKSGIQTADTINGVEITMPAKLRIGVALFMTFWLCGWAFGLVSVANQLLSGRTDKGATLFLVAWLGAWIVGGAWAMVTLAWMLIGREIVRANVVELQHVRQLGPFSMSREYEMAQVKRLRIFHGDPAASAGRYALGGPFGGGTVAFDYGASTKRFGMGLDEAEAHTIVELLTKRFRNLAA